MATTGGSAEYLIQAPAMGLNALLPDNMIDAREAARGSKNVLYDRGLFKTPFGFAKLDLTTGLTGSPVMGLFQWFEDDRTSHVMALTKTKVYDHDYVNSTWDDVTEPGADLNGTFVRPFSVVEIPHTDGIYLDDDDGRAQSFHHVIICDGGGSAIRRWAGRRESTVHSLQGADYNLTSDEHRAEQVVRHKSRLLLINPYNNDNNVWEPSYSTIRWGAVGLIETSAWNDAAVVGAGSVNLLETGGSNIWAAQLGSELTVYQNRGIWTLGYVGGTDVFRPRVEIPNLGLLSAHLLVARNNVHYFLASDYNIYAYYGGSVLEPIGDKIRDQLVDDIEPEYIHRCWMALGPQNKTLWLFIVPPDGQYITTAYVMDLRTKAWMKRDFSQLFTDSRTGGLTSINLVSGETYTVGQTYRDWLQRYSPHDVGDATQVVKYGDALKGTEISEYLETSHTLDFSSGTWEAGGCCYSLAGATFNAEMTDNWILEVVDGSQGTNVEPGDHYYTLTEVSAVCFRVIPRFDGTEGQPAYSVDFSNGGPYEITINTILYDSDTTTKTCKVRTVAKMGAGTWAGSDATGRLWVISKTGTDFAANALIKRNSDDQTICNFHGDPTLLGRLGIADGSGATPADMSIIQDTTDHVIFNIWAVEVDEADTTDTLDSTWNYRSDVETVRTQERMLAGDASGFVYEFSDSLTTDDGVVPDAYHYTPVFDLQQPDKLKRWDEFVLTAKGDFCRVEYSIDDGATWTECAMFTLTSTWDDYHFFVPRTSERIQFRISNTYSTTNLVNDPAFESDANTSTDTYWDKYIWSTDPVTLRITKSTSATPTTFVWAYLGESTETLDPDDYAVAAQADDLRVYPGIRYRLRYRLYARTDAAVSFCTAVTPQLAGVQGTEVTVSITRDDWTQKTDYITAGNRKDLKFSAMLDTTLTSYVHSLDVLALSDISLIPAPSAQTFEIREMKAVNIQFVDSR